MKTLRNLWEQFLVFCVLGWLYEVVWCCLIENNQGFVNRGFLFGPWLPIYGCGMLLILFAVRKLKIEDKPLLVFLTGTVIATITELIGSYIMEALTGSFMWNYSDYFGNFQGRIAVKPDMMFGFLTLIALYGVMSCLEKYQKKETVWRNTLTVLFCMLFLADLLFHLLKIA